MSDEDPVRLKDQRAASPELVRALRALGTSSDAARLERVAQKLGAALTEGQPPMAASGAGVLGVKVLVIGLVAAGIAALAWFGSNARTPAPEQPAPPVEVQAPSPPPPIAAVAPSAPLAELPPPASMPVKTTSRHAPSRARAAAASPASVEPRASTAPAAAAVATTQSASAATAPAPAPAADDSARQPAAPQPSAAEPEPLPSEAALLFGARKAMTSQPSAALRLLDQHAARFPDGLLTPEREVLRIEALHRLGRTSEAQQRLRAFQARYPDSIHLRRLQELVGGER